jgi:hypothetical protein
MKKLSVLFALLLSGIVASAQYVTEGKVIDKYGNPISGASVQGVGTSRFATTGIDGSYSLETPVRVKKIKVSSVGKQTRHESVSKKGSYTVVTLKEPSWWQNRPEEYHWFVSAQMDAGLKNCMPMGIMAGYVKRYGFYVRGVLTSSLPSTEGNIYYGSKEERLGAFTDSESSYRSITAGGLMNIGGSLFLYAGVGYAKREIALKHVSGGYYFIEGKNNSFFDRDYRPYDKSVCAEGGLMLGLGHVLLNAGVTVGGAMPVNIGIGYMF